MKQLLVPALLAFAWLVPAFAEAPAAPSPDPGDADTIRQISQTMGDAMIARDVATLSRIFADDWATLTSSGKIITKETMLHDFDSFHDRLEWFKCGPIDVQVFGNVAVANGTVTEKRTRNGKDTSGDFVWVDLLEKRAGQWVVVRSQSTTLK